MTRSFRCCGCNLSGLPAEPMGKEKIAWMTSVVDIVRGGDCVSSDGNGESGWEEGCFSCSNLSDSLFALHTGSVELTKRTAPLKFPSSSLAEALLARDVIP